MATKKTSKATKTSAKKGRKTAAKLPPPPARSIDCAQRCVSAFAVCLRANPGNFRACQRRLQACLAKCWDAV